MLEYPLGWELACATPNPNAPIPTPYPLCVHPLEMNSHAHLQMEYPLASHVPPQSTNPQCP